MRDTVVIVAPPADIHAISVARSLQQRGMCEPIILDATAFPGSFSLTIDGDGWIVRSELLNIRSQDVRSVWWRRPGTHKLDPTIAESSAKHFAANECMHAFDIIAMSDDYLVVNRPDREYLASRKPYQMKVASECGLLIPDYIITNDPSVFDTIIDCQERDFIFKTLTSPINTFGETR